LDRVEFRRRVRVNWTGTSQLIGRSKQRVDPTTRATPKIVFENRTHIPYMIDIRTIEDGFTMSTSLGYSEIDLIADLRTWWNDQVADAEDPFADPSPPRTGTIFEVVPVIDSLGVVTALLTIEKHVNFEVPARIIRAGGYRSFDDMTADLLPKIRALVIRERKKEAA
jgi:hypothetical protein